MQTHYRGFADLAHGFEHVQRVYHLALILSEQEQADGLIVGMAALLHDLGRTTRGPTRSHAARSAKLAKKLLASYDLPHERQQAILHAILAHGYRHGIEPHCPHCLTKNLTMRLSQNTLPYFIFCMFSQTTSSVIPLAKKTRSRYNAFNKEDFW